MSKQLKFRPKMYQICIFIVVLLLCLSALLYTSNSNSLDNAVSSIAPSVFELSIEIDDKEEIEINKIKINKNKFIDLFSTQLKENIGFYHGNLDVSFYFYNVLTRSTCSESVSCNGVQILIKPDALYMFGGSRTYCYEVEKSGR